MTTIQYKVVQMLKKRSCWRYHKGKHLLL